MQVKVLGPGCKNCVNLEKNVQKAFASMQQPVELDKVTDYDVMAKYGLMRTPGLVINDKLVSAGLVLSPKQIIAIVEKMQ